jgi:uncharacterized protein (DUF2062 family)
LGLSRFSRYYLLKFIRIKGEPYDLALGMALGVFSAMLPILPFHIALAVALALVFRVSKITALIGVFVCNPFTFSILYFFNYRIGAFILNLHEDNRGFSSIMGHIQTSGWTMETILRIAHASWTIIAAFFIGGLIMGVVAAVPTYFIFLKIFNLMRDWRQKVKERRSGQKWNR